MLRIISLHYFKYSSQYGLFIRILFIHTCQACPLKLTEIKGTFRQIPLLHPIFWDSWGELWERGQASPWWCLHLLGGCRGKQGSQQVAQTSPHTGTTEIHIPKVCVAEPWTSWGGQTAACHHCPQRGGTEGDAWAAPGVRSERSRHWGSGGRLRHRCPPAECPREGHLASVGPDGIAHGSPLAWAVSTEAAPKVTACLGRDLADLPLPPHLLGFGRPVGFQTTSCSPLNWGELPGDLPEDSFYQPLPWHERLACSRRNKEKSKQNTVVHLHLS